MIELFIIFRFDGKIFVDDLDRGVQIRIHQNKEPKQIRYINYTTWAVALRKKDVGPEGKEDLPHYTFPPFILSYLRTLVPGNIKGEFRDDAYEVSTEEFCSALDIPKL